MTSCCQQETLIEQLKSRKKDILENCELQQITLPNIGDPMEIDSSVQSISFDYSELNKSGLRDIRSSDRDKKEAEFKQKMDSLTSEIERTAPNLKALDQYEALQEKEKEAVEEFEAARREEKEVTDQYNLVKRRRYILKFCAQTTPILLMQLASMREKECVCECNPYFKFSISRSQVCFFRGLLPGHCIFEI